MEKTRIYAHIHTYLFNAAKGTHPASLPPQHRARRLRTPPRAPSCWPPPWQFGGKTLGDFSFRGRTAGCSELLLCQRQPSKCTHPRPRCPRRRARPRAERGSQRPPVQQGTKFCTDGGSKELLHVVWACGAVFSRNIPQTRRFPRKWRLGSLRLAAHRTCSRTGLPVSGTKEKKKMCSNRELGTAPGPK